MTDEPTIEQLLEPSSVLSHALDFMEGLPAARMKIEGGKLWLRIFEEIQGAITRYGSGWEA